MNNYVTLRSIVEPSVVVSLVVPSYDNESPARTAKEAMNIPASWAVIHCEQTDLPVRWYPTQAM